MLARSVPLFFLLPSNAYAFDMSAEAQLIIDKYRVEWCEAATEVAGYKVTKGTKPVFAMGDKSYQQVKLTNSGVVGEIIFTGDMTCNGYPIYASVGGNSTSHIVVDGEAFEIFGGEPFVIEIDAKRTPYPEFFNEAALVAWWGWGENCAFLGENGISSGVKDCLHTAYYSESERSLVFQSDSIFSLPRTVE
jgi:hypothetical protein